ncbi:MAG: extracellular solute-binding protein [Bryobacteraceae bacterium]
MKRDKTFRIAVRKFDPFESAIRKQWDAFEAITRTGLTLQAEAFDLRPLTETLFEREGLLRGDWDVAFINTDWVAAIHESRAVVDLADFLKENPPDDYPQGWMPSLLRLQEIEGAVLGLPYHDGPECLIYRKDLFSDPNEQSAYQERFGHPLRVPRTWQEFHQMARFFQRPEKGVYGTAFAAFPDGHNTVYDFLLQLWTRGGELVDNSGQIHLETPEAIEALRFYRSILQDNSAVHPQCFEMDSVKSGLAFAAGEIAMMVNWFGFAAMSETIAESRVKGRVDIANVPHGKTGSTTSLNIYWTLSIASGSPHREIAYDFLRHCLTARMDKLLTREGAIGCRKSTWNDPDVNRTVPFYSRLESLHTNAREIPRLAEWPRIALSIDELMLKVIQTDKPIDQLTRQAQVRASALFAPIN